MAITAKHIHLFPYSELAGNSQTSLTPIRLLNSTRLLSGKLPDIHNAGWAKPDFKRLWRSQNWPQGSQGAQRPGVKVRRTLGRGRGTRQARTCQQLPVAVNSVQTYGVLQNFSSSALRATLAGLCGASSLRFTA